MDIYKLFKTNFTELEKVQAINEDLKYQLGTYGYLLKPTEEEGAIWCQNPDEHFYEIMCHTIQVCANPYDECLL